MNKILTSLRNALAFIINIWKNFYSTFVAHSLLYLIAGIVLIIFILWNRLRLRLPRNVTIEITTEVLKLFFQALPIIIFLLIVIRICIKIYIEIKQKYFPNKKPSKPMVKVGKILHNFSLTIRREEHKIYQSIVRILIKLNLGPILLFLFCWLVNGGPFTENNYVGKESDQAFLSIIPTKRFQFLIKLSQFTCIMSSIIGLIGIIEMFFFKELNFFYMILPLLLVPVIWKSFLFFVLDYSRILLRLDNIFYLEKVDKNIDLQGGETIKNPFNPFDNEMYRYIDEETVVTMKNPLDLLHDAETVVICTKPEKDVALFYNKSLRSDLLFLHNCQMNYDYDSPTSTEVTLTKFYEYKCYFELRSLSNILINYCSEPHERFFVLLTTLVLRMIFFILMFWDLSNFFI
jgi:hypothetical protein